MTDHRVLVLVSMIFPLGGCAADAGSTIRSADLAAHPADYEGRTVTVTGGVETTVLLNAAFCESLPCNNGAVEYHFGTVPIRAAEAFEGPIAEGVHPQPSFGSSYGPTQVGCDGNDVEMMCAPAIPSAIASLTGRVVDGVLLVDADELVAGAPTTETLEGPPGYAAITLRTVSE